MYDWKPTLCKFCSKYGHAEDECRKKKAPQKSRKDEKQTTEEPKKRDKQQQEGAGSQQRMILQQSKENEGTYNKIDGRLKGKTIEVWVTPQHTNRQQSSVV